MQKGLAMVAAVLLVVVMVPVVLFAGVFSSSEDATCVPLDSPGSGDSGSSVVTGADGTVHPMDRKTYQYSDYFGTRGGAHQGLDMAAPNGTPIYAYAPGTVMEAGTATGFGHWIVLDHNLGGKLTSSVYGHMYADGVLVKKGDKVKAGQLIGKVGSDGGSDGPHLHFEIWTGGGRLSGGHAIDPKPIIDKLPDPRAAAGSGGASKVAAPGPSAPRAPPTSPAAPSTSSAPSTGDVDTEGELPPLPKRMGSEAHLQVDSIRIARAVAAKYPQLKTIGGWRPSDPYPDHPSGRSVDVMIPNYDSAEGKALGDSINKYILDNRKTFQVTYTIWRQVYYPADPSQGKPNLMEDRGSPTQNHFDHVHVTTVGHGYPAPGTKFGPAPGGGGEGSAPSPECAEQPGDPRGGMDNLGKGKVPPAFEPWVRKAGAMCPQIRSSLIAAQIEQESGFQTHAVSSTGAQGPAQFMPGTWPSWGKDDDHNGTVSPNDIGDAVMAQGRYMCAIAKNIDAAVASGKVKDDYPGGKPALYLAGYNAGEGAVYNAGGMPSGGDYSTQTRPYADKILSREKAFAGQNTD